MLKRKFVIYSNEGAHSVSKRWGVMFANSPEDVKRIRWMLTQANLDAREFVHVPYLGFIESNMLEIALSELKGVLGQREDEAKDL